MSITRLDMESIRIKALNDMGINLTITDIVTDMRTNKKYNTGEIEMPKFRGIQHRHNCVGGDNCGCDNKNIRNIAAEDAGHGTQFNESKENEMIKEMLPARSLYDVTVNVLFGIPLIFGLYFFLDDLYDLSNPVTEIIAIKCTAFALLAFIIQGYLLNRLINLIYKPLKLVGNGLSKIFRKK